MQERILLFFQEHATSFWDAAAEGATMLGEQYFFIVVITFVYWVVSRKQGFKLAAIFVFSSVLNGALKIALRTPRPFEKLAAVSGKRVETATGYSFPSGHTQGSASFFTAAALILKRWWVSFIAAVLMVTVALTRVYLGVHWPADVAGGLVLGVLIAVGLNRFIDSCEDNPKRLKLVFLILEGAVFLLTAALLVLDTALWHGSWKIHDFFKVSGISLGLVAGYFFQERHVRFNPAGGSTLQKILRYVLGLAITVGLLPGLKAVFPEHLVFDYLRYGIIGFWVAFLWPLSGMRLRLFVREEG